MAERPLDARDAAWLWSGRTSTVAGLSAAALMVTRWIDPRRPAELYRRNEKPVDGIVIHRDGLREEEVCTVRGMPVITPARTTFDLGRRTGQSSAVICGAESPQESRSRQLLVRSGLPKPDTQIVVRDRFYYSFARIDRSYVEWKIGIDFDGAQHWIDPAQRTADIDRYAELAASGWTIIRVSSDLIRYRPIVIVARVCAAFREAGAEWPVLERFPVYRVA